MSTTKPSPKPKLKSTARAKPIVKGDVVLLSHKRIGVVRYVGDIAEYIEKGIWYGIEIRMTAGLLGDSNGIIGTTTYFKCAVNEGLFVRLHEIQRRIEPKELLEKVVKLTKIKNSMHQLLNQTHNELTNLKKKFNISPTSQTNSSSKYDYRITKKKNRPNSRKHSNNLTFDNHNSGSITYEPSISISDSLNIYDTITNNNNNNNNISDSDHSHSNSIKHSPIKLASPIKVSNYCVQNIKQWDNKRVIKWIQSIGDVNNKEWVNIIYKLSQYKITGNDLLCMNDTNLLSDKLNIVSTQIKNKIINEFNIITNIKNKKNKISLMNSLSSPALPPTQTTDVIVNKNNGKPFSKYQRLSHSNKYVYDTDIDDVKEDKNGNININIKNKSFNELYVFYNKMDANNKGRIDLNSFRYMLVEMDPELKPYRLTNDTIKKCFDQFDLTKNGYITIEEFIVIMGKTYLRGLSKSKTTQLTKTDIKQYFTQMIKHFLKKQQKNINYNDNIRKKSISRSKSNSKTKPPPPPPRKRSTSRSRNGRSNGRPPPPKRDASPSNNSYGNY